jgi:hypothetical protein
MVATALALTGCNGGSEDESADDTQTDTSETSEESWEGVGEGLPEPVDEEDDTAGEEVEVEDNLPEGCVLDSTLVICPDEGQEDAASGTILDATYSCRPGWEATETSPESQIGGNGWIIQFTPEPDGLRIQVIGEGQVFAGIIAESGKAGTNIVRLEGNDDWDTVIEGDYGDAVTVCLPTN